jgi:N-acetyl-gamma-glutamylphosphate reductase
MNKKVVIVGSTGMVGVIVLQLCLQHQDVNEVIALVRKSTPIQHEKYNEVVVADFLNYDMYTHLFNYTDIIYYCLFFIS